MSATSSHHSQQPMMDASLHASAPNQWLDALPDAVALCDAQGVLTQANAAMRALLAISTPLPPPHTSLSAVLLALAPLDVTGQPIAPERLPLTRLLRGEALSGGAAADVQLRVPGGQHRWFSMGGTVQRNPAGEITGALLTLHDVTERRQPTTPELHEIADAAPALLWQSGTDARQYYVNSAWQRFTGHTSAPDLGEEWIEDLHPDDRARYQQAYQQAFQARQAFSSEYRLRRHDGVFRWFLDQGVPRYADDGAFLGYVGSSVDISPLKDAETVHADALFVAETGRRQLEAIMQVLPAGIAIYDEEGRLITQNPAAEQITGRSASRRERATSRQARYGLRDVDGNAIPESRSPSGRARRGETFSEMATVFTNMNGEERFLLTSGAPILDDQQAIKGAVVVFQDVTQLYHLQREVNDQRKFAESIIDTTPFGLAVFAPDDDFRCLRHNAPFLQLTGADWQARGDITDVPLADLFDEESATRTRAVFEQVRASGEAFFLPEYPAVLLPDPQPRWYEWSLTPLYDSVGTLTGLMVAAVEITELVRAREAKEREVARLHGVLNVLPTGVVIADLVGKTTEFNEAFYRVWGKDAPSLETVAEYDRYVGWWSDGRQLSADEWAMAVTLRTGEAVMDQELEIETFDGQRRTVLNSAAPIRDRITGEVIGGAVAIRDITALKHLERRTQASLNALLRMAQQAVLTGEDILDVAHGIAQVTREVLGCQRVGVTAVDVTTGTQKGLAVVGLTASEEAHWWKLQESAGRFGEGADPQLLARFLAGEPLVIDMTQPPNNVTPNDFGITQALFIPLLLDGAVLGVLSLDYAGVPHDFTEQDFALARGVADLAALVLERERLQRAHAEAQALAYSLEVTNARMNTFLGIASHELRTPITSVKTSVQMTERGLRRLRPDSYDAFIQQAPRLLELLGVADREIDKLNRFIGDLLDVTHIQSGTIELTPVRTDLADIVRDVARTQAPQWPQRVVQVHLPQHPVPVLGDVDRVGQVVTNLLTNALKYAPAERPIAVRLLVRNDTARVEIADEGPGLTPRQQAELFQAFGRIEAIAPLNSSSVGLGLGLFICKTIIEMLGGHIGVVSQQGHGATFWFELPLLQA